MSIGDVFLLVTAMATASVRPPSYREAISNRAPARSLVVAGVVNDIVPAHDYYCGDKYKSRGKAPAVGPTRKLRILAKSQGNSRFLEGC